MAISSCTCFWSALQNLTLHLYGDRNFASLATLGVGFLKLRCPLPRRAAYSYPHSICLFTCRFGVCREVKRGVRGKEQDHNARWHTTVAKAAQSVKNARSRIYNDKSLLELPDVGPSVLAVRCHLFDAYVLTRPSVVSKFDRLVSVLQGCQKVSLEQSPTSRTVRGGSCDCERFEGVRKVEKGRTRTQAYFSPTFTRQASASHAAVPPNSSVKLTCASTSCWYPK